MPLPLSLNANRVKRRLTATLAWLTPANPRHSKYRVARLWIDVPDNDLRLKRTNGESRQVQQGTLQHEVFEGESAVPIVDGQEMVIRVNCVADAGRLNDSVEFALCVTLEVGEGLSLPIYGEIRARVTQRVEILSAAKD